MAESDRGTTDAQASSSSIQTLNVGGSSVAHIGNVYNTYQTNLRDDPGVIGAFSGMAWEEAWTNGQQILLLQLAEPNKRAITRIDQPSPLQRL